MEPRFALSAVGLDEYASVAESLHLLDTDPAALAARSESALSADVAASDAGISANPSGAITSIVVDSDGAMVTKLEEGVEYRARVLVQDARGDAFESDTRGVFAAFVDVEFSSGLRITDSPTFSPTFANLRVEGIERSTPSGTTLENVGAVHEFVLSATVEPQWLFDVPFVADSTEFATSISVRPSPRAAQQESFLLFGSDIPVSPANVVASDLRFDATPLVPSPTEPAETPAPLIPPPLETGTVPDSFGQPEPANVLISVSPLPTELDSIAFPSRQPSLEVDLELLLSDWFRWRMRIPRFDRLESEPESNDESVDAGDGMLELNIPNSGTPSRQTEPLSGNAEEANERDETESSLDEKERFFEPDYLWGIADLLEL
ncbi:MAG: hypothetical protein AAFU85_06670, partial [Planctomycetota bacterium]